MNWDGEGEGEPGAGLGEWGGQAEGEGSFGVAREWQVSMGGPGGGMGRG